MTISINSPELSNINLGRALVRYRNLTGLSEHEVAEKLGLSKNYIRLLEWGLVNHVSNKVRWRILKLLVDTQ